MKEKISTEERISIGTKISVQLYTFRKYLKTPEQIRETLSRIKETGINNIEAARIKFTRQEAVIFQEACSKLGITIGSSQIKYKKIIRNFDKLVEIHKLWGCSYIAVSVMPTGYILKGEQGIRLFAEKLNALGECLKAEGLNLLYHHHHFEYVKYGKQTGLELLMELTNPSYVNLMMDSFWTQKGGKNPVDQIVQFHDRIKIMHLRDYTIERKLRKADYVVKDCALGDGNLDILSILETAKKYNILFCPIEQNTKKPFAEVVKSTSYLKELGFEDLL